MPKPTATITRTQGLAQEISQLEEAIATTQRNLLEQQQENSEFAEAIRLLSVDVAKYVPTGRIALMDALNAHLDEASNQSDRDYRWSVAQKVLASGQEAAANLQASLIELRRQFAIAEDEHDWEQHYAPHLDRYKDSFTSPSPDVRKEQEIKRLQDDIGDRKVKLERAQAWLAQPEEQRNYYGGDAMREVQYLGEAIPVLTAQLQRLIAQPVARDEVYERQLREHIKARVAVEPALTAFLTAQEEYLIALAEFKLAIAEHPQACQFPGIALPTPRIVSSDDDGIKLVDVAPRSASKRLW